jgi:endonuclease YncB( thermonuclease family)
LKPARLLLAALVLAMAGPALAESRRCLVVGVSDGDTITARCGEPGSYEQIRVRLAGIDAPERRQAYGERARQHLAALVFQRWAALECGKVDRYGRSVCLVRVAPASRSDGAPALDVGLSMVSAGMAWWYRAYAREQAPEDRGRYEAAELAAQAQRQACGPMLARCRRGSGGGNTDARAR